MKQLRVTPKRLIILATALVAIWLLSSYAVAFHYLHRARPRYQEPSPTVACGKIESLQLHTSDGEHLGAWFIAGETDRPLVILLHGNNTSRASLLPQAELLAPAGYGLLMVTLRAHGDSTGELNDFGLSARHDVVAAVDWLNQHQSGRPIVVWGLSLGAAASVFAADELGQRVSGYILECPYRDLRTAVWNRLHSRLLPPLDLVAYAGLRIVSQLVLSDIDRISLLATMDKIPPSIPVLILAGGADTRARPEEAQALAERIHSHAKLVTIVAADHLQLQSVDPATYRQAILDFLGELWSMN